MLKIHFIIFYNLIINDKSRTQDDRMTSLGVL